MGVGEAVSAAGNADIGPHLAAAGDPVCWVITQSVQENVSFFTLGATQQKYRSPDLSH